MSDEEEDYMSLKFLQNAEEFESKRVATYSERRKKQLREHEEKRNIKPRAQLEQEEREKALNKPIENNKGMNMLMKMGFKKGSTLGAKSQGIAEPIRVDLKANRFGLGMESAFKKRALELEEQEANKKTKTNPDDFRNFKAQQAKENQLQRYLTAAVSICEKLDQDKETASNILWILKPIQINDEQEPEELEKEIQERESPYPEQDIKELKELPLDQKVTKVIDYLRNTHFYCFWCSAKYTDQPDLDANCPGPLEDDH